MIRQYLKPSRFFEVYQPENRGKPCYFHKACILSDAARAIFVVHVFQASFWHIKRLINLWTLSHNLSWYHKEAPKALLLNYFFLSNTVVPLLRRLTSAKVKILNQQPWFLLMNFVALTSKYTFIVCYSVKKIMFLILMRMWLNDRAKASKGIFHTQKMNKRNSSHVQGWTERIFVISDLRSSA